MAAAKLSTETVFLREFARTYIHAISFSPEALRFIEDHPGLGLGDVMHVLKRAVVFISEKESADGTRWFAQGKTCDDSEMTLVLRVWTDRYSIRVQKISVRGIDK